MGDACLLSQLSQSVDEAALASTNDFLNPRHGPCGLDGRVMERAAPQRSTLRRRRLENGQQSFARRLISALLVIGDAVPDATEIFLDYRCLAWKVLVESAFRDR